MAKKKSIIQTNSAPKAIGTYSQAVLCGNTLYLSGQIPLIPETMELVQSSIEDEIHQVFKNIRAVLEAAGAQMSDLVKLNIYLTDLSHFAAVNEIMKAYFTEPYPARAAIGVAALPKGARVEADGVAVIFLP